MEHDPIRWEKNDFYGRTSAVVVATVGSKAKAVVKRLHLDEWSFDRPITAARTSTVKGFKGVLHIISNGVGLEQFLAQEPGADPLPEGLSKEDARARLRLLFSRGIMCAAIAVQAAVVCSGIDCGDVAMMGKANAGWNWRVPLLAVVPKRRVRYPGDDRPGKWDRAPLQPDLTHVVRPRPATPAARRAAGDIDSESEIRPDPGGQPGRRRHRPHPPVPVQRLVPPRWMVHQAGCAAQAGGAVHHQRLERRAARVRPPPGADCAPGADGRPAPAAQRMTPCSFPLHFPDTRCLRFVHLGWPIVVVRGTGGLADMIAACKMDSHTFLPDERLMEVRPPSAASPPVRRPSPVPPRARAGGCGRQHRDHGAG